jgi:hypothetical protein
MLRISAQHRIGGHGPEGWLVALAVLVSACTADPGASGAVDTTSLTLSTRRRIMFVRRTSTLLAGVILLAVAGCGGTDSSSTDPAGATSTAAASRTAPAESTAPPSSQPVAKDTPAAREKVVVNAEGGGAGKGLCTLFSAGELSSRLGAELGDGEISGPLDSACQWTVKTGSGNVMIQRIPASFWSAPTQRKSYKALTGIGDKAYTSPGMFDGDWDAAAMHGKFMTIASLNGPNANAPTATALLKETLTRG